MDKNAEMKTATIDEARAAQYAVYAMMANNCYHSPHKRAFDVQLAGWHQVDLKGAATTQPTKTFNSGFAFDVFHHHDGESAVIAFRGTDSLKDWFWANLGFLVSVPYKQAAKAVEAYRKECPSRKNIALAGHSLGGGMALGTSARLGLPAYAFNPSPRVFDGLGNKHLAADRVVVCQAGDLLQKVGEFWWKIPQLVPHVFSCPYDVPKKQAHRIDLLAWNLGKHGAQHQSVAGQTAARLVAGYEPANHK